MAAPVDTTVIYDVAIIGGGPAGLSAGLWLGRYLRHVILIDSGDPRNWETRGIHGILGQHGIRPPELRAKGREECREAGVVLHDGTVETISRTGDDPFHVELQSGDTVTARRILLTTGITDVWPDIPGLDRCYGDTAHVCPDCDGYEAREKNIVVIGTGRKAAGLALALTTWSSHIIICTNGEPPALEATLQAKLEHLGIRVITAKITKARSHEGEVFAIDVEGGIRLDCDRIFFAIAQHPHDALGTRLGCARDEIGRVIVDEHYHTSVQHVYAAGDIIHGSQLAVVAMAGGAVAANAIHHSLLPETHKLD